MSYNVKQLKYEDLTDTEKIGKVAPSYIAIEMTWRDRLILSEPISIEDFEIVLEEVESHSKSEGYGDGYEACWEDMYGRT